MSDPLQTLLESSARIAKRSLLSAFYLAGLTGLILIAPDYNSVLKGNIVALFGLLAVLAIPFAHGSYEIVMPLNRKLSAPKVLKGFQDVIGKKTDTSQINYDFLRSWKHEFLEDPTSERLKSELEKELALRQQMTYLFAATIIGFLVVITIGFAKEKGANVIWLGLGISAFMFVVSLFGHYNRSYALGRTYGHAYLSWISKGT
jgi:hypothetical protein